MKPDSRRAFLRGAGATALGIGLVAGSSSRARAIHFDQQPSHVTLEFAESWLDTYKPRLVFPKDSRDKLIGLYAWKASSPEHDTDVGVYWASYTHQSGVTEYDSHFGDHEPFYVYVDGSGELERIAYSAYHWIKAESTSFETDQDNPLIRVIEPWHHYVMTNSIGTDLDLVDLDGEFSSWLDNGLERDLEPGSVVNPWTMLDREDWWKDGTFGLNFARLRVELNLVLGRHKAEETDL